MHIKAVFMKLSCLVDLSIKVSIGVDTNSDHISALRSNCLVDSIRMFEKNIMTLLFKSFFF